MAFVIFVPLPKAKGSIKYVLTYVCMATKWPEAVPFQGVTATEVEKGLFRIISRTGIPEKILTDQGSVFLGKVINKLCEVLGCVKIRISPCRPQGNGVVKCLMPL